MKKRLTATDRELIHIAYQQAESNNANDLGYIVAILNSWEKLGIKKLEDWENHEKERENLTDDDNILPF
ncbi:DnaD domain protein [Streptococcus dysgalactiae]|uniref:DnaD domain protein n=1 Tax=Streptococcus dysgalactiae TaxID=1334 RepID=UPI001F371ECE|nr:DnaD domain protein [Streptococcus dysgalactiae]